MPATVSAAIDRLAERSQELDERTAPHQQHLDGQRADHDAIGPHLNGCPSLLGVADSDPERDRRSKSELPQHRYYPRVVGEDDRLDTSWARVGLEHHVALAGLDRRLDVLQLRVVSQEVDVVDALLLELACQCG